MLPELPAVIIILVIEHIAIAKSFGRTFNYTVVPSQEILAQGASNLLGTFVGGYVCTGSFGASAVLSKAGVQTPLAGLFSAVILVLALHVLTAVFYYIPNAALAGLIIHAVANLPTPPRVLYKYWRISPLELIIWVIGVILAIVVSLVVSIYVTICISLALVLIRIARAKGQFLGKARVYHIHAFRSQPSEHLDDDAATNPPAAESRNIYLPLSYDDGSNSSLSFSPPHPGIFIYRFPTTLNYTNQSQHMRRLVRYIKAHTRPGTTSASKEQQPTTRPWSESPEQRQNQNQDLPALRGVILDCTALDTLDMTSAQGLADARMALDGHADGSAPVRWHFAGMRNRWAIRALVGVGFGGGGFYGDLDGAVEAAVEGIRKGGVGREGETGELA